MQNVFSINHLLQKRYFTPGITLNQTALYSYNNWSLKDYINNILGTNIANLSVKERGKCLINMSWCTSH